MCFRPPSAEAGKKCPECGANNPAVAKACSSCGAELPAGPSVPQVPGVPGAPKAPGSQRAERTRPEASRAQELARAIGPSFEPASLDESFPQLDGLRDDPSPEAGFSVCGRCGEEGGLSPSLPPIRLTRFSKTPRTPRRAS